MPMKVCIYVDESMFKGEYGIYDICVADVIDITEARDIAMEMGDKLYDSFERIFLNRGIDLDSENSYINISIYSLKSGFINLSSKLLNDKCILINPKEFIRDYCDKELFFY